MTSTNKVEFLKPPPVHPQDATDEFPAPQKPVSSTAKASDVRRCKGQKTRGHREGHAERDKSTAPRPNAHV